MKRLYWIIIQMITIPVENRVENLTVNRISDPIINEKNLFLQELLGLIFLDLNQRIEKKLGTELFDIIKPDMNDHHKIYKPPSSRSYAPYDLGLFVLLVLGFFYFVSKYFSGLNIEENTSEGVENQQLDQNLLHIFENEQFLVQAMRGGENQQLGQNLSSLFQNVPLLTQENEDEENQSSQLNDKLLSVFQNAQLLLEIMRGAQNQQLGQGLLSLLQNEQLLTQENENQVIPQNHEKEFLFKEGDTYYVFEKEEGENGTGQYIKKKSPLFNFLCKHFSFLDSSLASFETEEILLQEAEQSKQKLQVIPINDLEIQSVVDLCLFFVPNHIKVFSDKEKSITHASFGPTGDFLDTLDGYTEEEILSLSSLPNLEKDFFDMTNFFYEKIWSKTKDLRIEKGEDLTSFIKRLLANIPTKNEIKNLCKYIVKNSGVCLVLSYKDQTEEFYWNHVPILKVIFTNTTFLKTYEEDLKDIVCDLLEKDKDSKGKECRKIKINRELCQKLEDISKDICLVGEDFFIADFEGKFEEINLSNFNTKKTYIEEISTEIKSESDFHLATKSLYIDMKEIKLTKYKKKNFHIFFPNCSKIWLEIDVEEGKKKLIPKQKNAKPEENLVDILEFFFKKKHIFNAKHSFHIEHKSLFLWLKEQEFANFTVSYHLLIEQFLRVLSRKNKTTIGLQASCIGESETEEIGDQNITDLKGKIKNCSLFYECVEKTDYFEEGRFFISYSWVLPFKIYFEKQIKLEKEFCEPFWEFVTQKQEAKIKAATDKKTLKNIKTILVPEMGKKLGPFMEKCLLSNMDDLKTEFHTWYSVKKNKKK